MFKPPHRLGQNVEVLAHVDVLVVVHEGDVELDLERAEDCDESLELVEPVPHVVVEIADLVCYC